MVRNVDYSLLRALKAMLTSLGLILEVVGGPMRSFFLENYMIKCVFQTVASIDSEQSGMQSENTKSKTKQEILVVFQEMMKSPRQQGQLHERLVTYEGRCQGMGIEGEEHDEFHGGWICQSWVKRQLFQSQREEGYRERQEER